MRVVLCDPSAFTPQYDHELAAALARAGADVELVTSRFRFGDPPAPAGYERRELFYPLSSRLFRRSPLRLPLKAIEHPLGMARLARLHADVVHLQWLAWPRLDRAACGCARRRCSRRTISCRGAPPPGPISGGGCSGASSAIVVHSERGRESLAELGVAGGAAARDPAPGVPSDPPRADDGRTLLCLGVIRPYKGLGDAIEAAKRVDGARLLVAGDPDEPLDGHRARAGAIGEWRLGYLPEAELDRALGGGDGGALPLPRGARPVGSAPAGARRRRARGRLRRRRARRAGRALRRRPRRARRATSRRWQRRSASCSATPRRSSRRAGRVPAVPATELTWDASAAAHLELYRELA